MDYNSQNFNQPMNRFNQSNVPPYPQPSFETRTTETAIAENKESEFSFVNSVLKKAIGRTATYYFSYPDSIKWRDISYEGEVQSVGEDYIVIKEKGTGYFHVLLMLYLEWVVFKDEKDAIVLKKD